MSSSLSDRTLPPCVHTNTTDSCAPYGVCAPIAPGSNVTACVCGIYRDPTANCTSLYHLIPEWRQEAYIVTLFVLISALLVWAVFELVASAAKVGGRALLKRPLPYVLLAVFLYGPFKIASGALATLDVIGGEPVHAGIGATVHLVGQNFLVLGYMGAATVWMTFLMKYQNLGHSPALLRVALAGCIFFMAVMVVNIVLTIVVYAAGQTLPLAARAGLQYAISFLPVISIAGITLASGYLRWRYIFQLFTAKGRENWAGNKHMRYFYVRSIVVTLTELVSWAYACYLVPSQFLWITNRAEVQQLLLETTLAWQVCTATFLICFAGSFDRPHFYARAFGCRASSGRNTQSLSSTSTGGTRKKDTSASTSSTVQTVQAE